MPAALLHMRHEGQGGKDVLPPLTARINAVSPLLKAIAMKCCSFASHSRAGARAVSAGAALRLPLWWSFFALFLAAVVLASSAHAQGAVRGDRIRTFPGKAATGNMQVLDGGPYILMGKKHTRLTPGARIYGTDGKRILPGKLTGQKIWVNYTANKHGVREVWILSEAEVRYFNRPRNRPPSARGDAEVVVPEKKQPEVVRGK